METRRWGTFDKESLRTMVARAKSGFCRNSETFKVLSKGTQSTSSLAPARIALTFLEGGDRSSIKPGSHHPIGDYCSELAPNPSYTVQRPARRKSKIHSVHQ